jgi:hypothetical protein
MRILDSPRFRFCSLLQKHRRVPDRPSVRCFDDFSVVKGAAAAHPVPQRTSMRRMFAPEIAPRCPSARKTWDFQGTMGFTLMRLKFSDIEREPEFWFVLFSFYCNIRQATSGPGRSRKRRRIAWVRLCLSVDCAHESVAGQAIAGLPLRQRFLGIRTNNHPALIRQFIERAPFIGPVAG